ncbi:MAG: sigma-70 family RNA polymerase sigma factor, partial [Myxococcales bacterium]|nr:sigma-70 family RNA polymerase sigma factor [Myxococcales bacterium]
VRRNKGRRPQISWEDPRIEAAVVGDAEGNPRRAVELHETYGQLLAAFDTLSETLRTTLVLTTLQGMSHAEAAVVLDTTEGTVAWRVHEARKQLNVHLMRLQREPTPTGVRLKASEVGNAHTSRGFDAALALLIPMLADREPSRH